MLVMTKNQQVDESKKQTVEKEICTEKGSGQRMYQNKKNRRRTKRTKPQKGWTTVRIGRWKMKRDDTAIE